MNWYQGRNGILMGCTAAILGTIAQPVYAAETELTGIQLRPTDVGFELVLNIQGNNRPPIFTVNRGNSSVTDISNTQLRLPDGETFVQADPAPGIKSIAVRQLDANTVRIVVDGVSAAPISGIVRDDGRPDLLVLDFERSPSANASIDNPIPPTGQPPSTSPGSPSASPPFEQRATAPPVGDMAIAPLDVTPDKIELDSGQIIPKLLLREAPVREVLTLLGRASGLNVAFADGETGAEGAGPTISLDIENESVDDVFNYVLRLSGLQANRVGNTIFVGETLPGDAQNRVVRTIRLNQLKATAEGSVSKSISTSADTGGSVGGDTGSSTTAQTAISRANDIQETSDSLGAKELLEDYGANEGTGSSALLEGLEVVADARTNSVTLIGTPRKVDIATSLLQRLDVRQRQVAVNVKFIDVNLLKGKDSNADLLYRANTQTAFIVNNGVFNARAGRNPGPVTPPQVIPGSGNITTREVTPPLAIPGLGIPGLPAALDIDGITSLAKGFFLSLVTSVREGNAKILTNPTLLVQEGSSAQVNLTEQIFSGFEITSDQTAAAAGSTVVSNSQRPIFQNAGVILNVNVERIDDNGFITMHVAPEVSAPSGTFTDQFGNLSTLLSQRRVETGVLRIRDGQTLVIAGIIQDQDRVATTKTPILGDLPLIGRFFRGESKERQRSELVVMITPQIVADNSQSPYGYQYNPGPEAEKMLRR